MSRVRISLANQAIRGKGALPLRILSLQSRWWAAVDSNHVPPRYQHGALPVELAARGLARRLDDFEPRAVSLEFTGSAATRAFSAGSLQARPNLADSRR